MKRKSVIFDLDGTLWEVIDVTYKSANEIANRYNLNEVTKKVICDTFGLNRLECGKGYFPTLHDDEVVKLMGEIAQIKNKILNEQGGNLYPNLKETLQKLEKNYRLFIVSNTAEDEYIEAFFNTDNLKDLFEDYIAASKIGLTKGEAIKKIIKDNDIKYSVYVGDTKKDKEAAKYANIPFIYAKYGFGDIEAENYIESISELPSALDNIFNM